MRSRHKIIGASAAFILLAFAGPGLSAQAVFNLSLTADQGSRWYEYFSDAFAELGTQRAEGGDGFWLISEFDNSGAYVPVGDGSPKVFPHGADFADIGSLTYDTAGLTGNGAETAAITGFTINFNPFVSDNDSILDAAGYTTSVGAFSGTVSLLGGQVTAINLSSAITFTYDAASFGLGALDYTGTFSVTGSHFELFVDQTHVVIPGLEPARYVWDVTGAVNNLTDGVIPEPSAYAAIFGALALSGALCRRRARA